MAEKRRGLGRGLGALIPSAPPADEREIPVEEPARQPDPPREEQDSTDDVLGRPAARPVDLFFERVTENDVAQQPRSYSSALRTGINKNVLDAKTKRVAKPGTRRPAKPLTSVRASEEAEPSALKEEADAADRTLEEGTPQVVVSPEPADIVVEASTDSNPAHGVDPFAGAGAENVSRETETSPSARGDELVEVPGATFAELPLDSIHPNRKQPRVEFNEDELAELVHSIREIGVLQPVVVRPSQEEGGAPYELVMGERRWRASREAGMETIPAIIRSTLDDDLLRDALLENLHRSALNPLEEAAAYQQLLDDFGCSHDELAGRLGRSRPQISNTLRLMKLPPLVQRRVAAGVLSAGHARALLGLDDPADMEKLAQRIVAEGLSVRSTEEIVALSGGLRRANKATAPRDGARHERLDYLATSLSDRLDTNVKITLGAKKGRVSIEFASVDDLNRIIGVLSPTSE